MLRLLALLLLITTTASAAEDLVQRARERQAEAEAALAAGRAQRLEERSALAERRTAATRTLMRLSARRQELQEQLQAKRSAVQAARQRLRQRELSADRLREALTTAYGVEHSDAVPEALEALIDRLAAATTLQVASERVIDRAGQARTVPVLRLGAVAAYAAGADAAGSGLLLIEPDRTPRIAGPPLDAKRQHALQALAAGQAALLPADVDGSLASRPPPAPWTFSGWIADGGVFAWPILGVSLLALLIACERAISLARLRTSAGLAEATLARLAAQGPTAARELVAHRRTPMARVLEAGLALYSTGRERLEAGLEAALLEEEPRFERALTLLAACAAVAPLLGLLGTVTGMIGTFDVIAVHGTGNPRLLSGGISEALVTTQMGLLAAVPILLCHAALSRVVDRRQVRLEQAATALIASREEPA